MQLKQYKVSRDALVALLSFSTFLTACGGAPGTEKTDPAELAACETAEAAALATAPAATAPAATTAISAMSAMSATSSPATAAMTTAAMAMAVPYSTGALKIPTGHPRIWWNADRLARAKEWYALKPFTPRADDHENLALHYVLTGNAASARKAIDWLMAFTISTTALSNDPARWFGQTAILIYDWCHDQMTAAERATIIQRWNGYVTALNAKPWGGIGMEGNNYYWGYLRNSILWAVASYHENAMADSFLTYSMKTRWNESALPFMATPGSGGVTHEGSQYGRYQLSYATVPFTTAAMMGYDMWSHTPFFKETLFGIIYATTGDTVRKGTTTTRKEMFPFNDDENFKLGGTAESAHFGDYLTTMIDRWRGSAMAGWAQQYLDAVKPPVGNLYAAVHTRATPRSLSELPLDYYAPGNGMFFGRTSWAPGTTILNLQLGRAAAVGHEHVDWGTFQIWRGGRWLTRETTGYAQTIAGYKGTGTVDCGKSVGHNGLLVGGIGIQGTGNRKGPPKVIRLESRANHSFAAVDLSEAFHDREGRADRDNPNAVRVVREFVYVRPLETTVVFDRIESTTPGAVKTFIVHFETPPTVGSGTVLAVNGDQALRMQTLIPAAPTYRVVTEGGAIGQYRLEAETSGTTESYMLNVLQGRGASEADVTSRVTDMGAAYDVTLTHPTKGSARISLAKGMTSTGGSFGYAASGTPAMAPLAADVQKMTVTDNGPVWE